MRHIGCGEICSGESRGQDDKEVTLVFNRKQLLYDIKNYAYIEGDVWGEEKQHGQHTLVEICEEGNIDRVNRLLEKIHSEITEALYPYTKEGVSGGEEIGDGLQAPRDYKIKMRVPGEMSRTTLRYLNNLIHEYMVGRVVGDWLSITHPEAARNWTEKAQEALESINEVKHMRRGMIRRQSYPF